MSFYNPSDRTFNRRYLDEVKMLFSAVDCVLHREHVIYASSELTSGFAVYEVLRRLKVKTTVELKKRSGEAWWKTDVFEPNKAAAIEFADSIRRRFNDRTIVITPAPFDAPDWSQPEYLYFWEELLRTRIRAAWFNRNWEFSNGCTFEFAVAQERGLPTFDHHGKTLTREDGIAAIRAAIHALDREGFDTSKLRENFEYLQAHALR